MPEDVTVQFQGGMNRRSDGPAQMPYELHNAKLGTHGGVRAYRAPEVMEDPDVNQDPNIADEPGGEKPWLRWNDQWFSRFSDTSNFKDADDEPVEVLQNYAKHNGNLYITGTRSRRLSGDTQYSPHTWRLGADATSYIGGDSALGSLANPPAIKSVTPSVWDPGDAGIQGRRGVGYLAIPVNAQGAAGPWAWFSNFPANDDPDTETTSLLSFTTNLACQYIELYRTREWKPDADITDIGLQPPSDLSYYYLDRLTVTTSETSDFSIDFTKGGKYYDTNHWPHEFESEEEEAKGVLPTDTLDRKINAWGYESVDYTKGNGYSYDVSYGDPRHVGAEAMQMVGRDRMMYGNPQWPTKHPQFAMIHHDFVTNTPSSGGGNYVYEYSIASEDSVVYGPTTQTPAETAYVIWQGEQAVNIWTEDLTEHADRMTTTPKRVYQQDSQTPLGADIDVSLFSPFDDTDSGKAYPGDVTTKTWVQEPNVVFLSERFRPMEVTFEDQYEVPEGEKIRAFSEARLAEEESIANYSFYIFTDEGVHTGELTAEEAQTYPVNTVGIKQHEVNPGNAPVYEYPIYAVTKYGTAYMGTDKRVYHLRGRQFEALDEPVPNIWYSDLGEPQFANVEYQAIYNEYSDVWSQVGGFSGDKTLTPFDMAYDQQRDQIMIATLDNVWIFDFEQQGWVGNYFASGVQNLQYIGDLDDPNTADHRAVMVHKNPGSSAEYLLLNEDGDPITDNAVVTNPLLRTANESKVREVTLDYDPLSKDADVSLTDGSTTVNVESGDSFDTASPSLDKMATVFIPDGEDGGSKNLTGVIESITDASTADMTEPAGVNASSTSPIPLRWFPPAVVRQEPTGDYYSTRDVNDDQVRRSEIAYKAHPRRTRYPRANGSGHIMRIEKFRNFKSMQLMVDKSDL